MSKLLSAVLATMIFAAPALAASSGEDFSPYVSSGLSEAEQAFMRGALAAFPDAVRADIWGYRATRRMRAGVRSAMRATPHSAIAVSSSPRTMSSARTAPASPAVATA